MSVVTSVDQRQNRDVAGTLLITRPSRLSPGKMYPSTVGGLKLCLGESMERQFLRSVGNGTMNTKHRLPLILVSMFAFGATASLLPMQKSAANAVDFSRDIQPIITSRCLSCHGKSKPKGGLRLTDLESATTLLKSGNRAIVPKQLDNSELLRRVATADTEERMPPKGEALTDRQIGLLKSWITDGANWPTHWSYSPLVRPRVPQLAVDYRERVRTPIDSFVLDELLSRKMAPSPIADKRTLLRRVYFDLIGLPPSADNMRDFLADSSPDAYKKVVERLLASPRYGEHWARHWLDIAHYADTHGNDHDYHRPNAWPYRDYVIRSFNDDKPYARFVAEQVAGDALFPDDPKATVALGFLAAGPWDHTLMSTIREDTVDHRMGQNLDRDNMVSTVMSTFTSLTVHCARCHDHKFDPITQREYYGLQAVFAGVDRADRSYDPDPDVHTRRKGLMAEKNAIASKEFAKRAKLDSPEMVKKVAALAKKYSDRNKGWKLLDVVKIGSSSAAGDTQFTKQADGSWFVSGARPDKDTFVITTKTELDRIKTLRLEVLPDKRLPHGGPGRYDNGNFHLSQVRATAQPLNGEGKSPKVIGFNRALADHSDAGDVVANVLNPKPNTYWSIHPHYNKSHDALFAIKEPVGFAGGTTLTIELKFNGKTGHQIGRFRLWASADAELTVPTTPAKAPPAIAAILSIPSEKLSQEQRLELARYLVGLEIENKLADLPAQQFVYAATNNFVSSGSFKPSAKPRPIHLLVRGDINQPGEFISPSATSCMTGQSASLEIADLNDESLRRAALARWLIDKRNVLTWRSIVNRVWHYHFGKGLCDTPSDFGKMGGAPSHPKLLNWLAIWFRDDAKGSLKSLHRLIVMSATYQQSSHQKSQSNDSDNRLLTRMNRTRLTGEMVRDSMLQMSGRIDLKMGGPSVVQFKHKGIGATFMPAGGMPAFLDYEHFNPDAPENNRRAIYRFVFRTVPDPLMEALDCPDGGAMTPDRTTSSTALQALALLNNALLIRQCEHIANRVSTKAKQPPEQINEVFRLMLQRPPTPREVTAFSAYIERHGLANACHILMNSNEFLYID